MAADLAHALMQHQIRLIVQRGCVAVDKNIVDAEMIRPAARFLLGAMALFFIPYGVGLMVSYEVLLDNFWAIVISGGVSTMLVLVCVGRVFQKLNKKA